MVAIRRFLSRRWLRTLLGVSALVFGLAMLHPYPRQSLFGPTIRGKPRCYWEAEVRRFGDRPPTFIDRTIGWLGVQRKRLSFPEVFDDPEMVPIVVDVLDDDDRETRHMAMTAITMYPNLQDRSALPSLHRLLASNEIVERAMAARTIWRISQDTQVIPVFLELLDQTDPILRFSGIAMIADEIGEKGDAKLFTCVAARASDADSEVRLAVMAAMKSYGKRGVPALIAGLSDSNSKVRQTAAGGLKHLGSTAATSISALEQRLTDSDVQVKREAANALRAIDRQRFEHLKVE